MNIPLLIIGLLFLTGGLIRVLLPHKLTGLLVRLLEGVHHIAFANWIRRNERLVRPIGVLMALFGLLCIYFSF